MALHAITARKPLSFHGLKQELSGIPRLSVVLLAIIAGIVVLARALSFFEDPRGLWNGIVHDRNYHAATALRIALAVTGADLVAFVDELAIKAAVWPPLHGVLAGTSWLLAGRDWRALVIPSLLGWWMCAVFSGLLAARLAGGKPAWLAALVAASCVLASPAHRAFSTDVMLESLGAGLTTAVLFLYAVALDDRRRSTAIALGLALTLLFFEKYNYWLIAVLGIGGAWLLENHNFVWARARAFRWRAFLRSELANPLVIASLTIFALGVAIALRGPDEIRVFGRQVGLQPPHNIFTLAYALAFVRAALAIRSAGWRPAPGLPSAIWWWHVLPVAASFLIPKRLGPFVKFLSPSNFGDAPTRPIPGALVFHLENLGRYYHPSVPLFVAAVLLAIIGFRLGPKLPAMRAVLGVLIVGGALTFLHPNQKSRFLHTWIPALWITAGVGAARLAGRARARLRTPAAASLAIACTAATAPAWFSPGRSEETGNRGETTSLLDISDYWLAKLPPGTPRIAMLPAQECQKWMEWTFLNQYAGQGRIIWPKDARDAASLATSLDQKSAEWLLALDIPPESESFTTIGDRPYVRRAITEWETVHPGWTLEWRGSKAGIGISLWRRIANPGTADNPSS